MAMVCIDDIIVTNSVQPPLLWPCDGINCPQQCVCVCVCMRAHYGLIISEWDEELRYNSGAELSAH